MNRLIAVTGGTKGIGRAVIEKFAANGFDIATCARHEEDLRQLKTAVEATHPGITVHVKLGDMSDKDQVKAFCTFVQQLGRPLDVLVNNAGYFIPGDIATEPEGTLESMIHANLYSAYRTTRGLIQDMKRNRVGHIFNICSVASIKAYPNGGSYAISKFALLGFTKSLREEMMPHNIRVTAVIPGATRTASWDGTDLPDERFMKVEDVAETVYGAYALSHRSVVEEIVIRPILGDL